MNLILKTEERMTTVILNCSEDAQMFTNIKMFILILILPSQVVSSKLVFQSCFDALNLFCFAVSDVINPTPERVKKMMMNK